MRIWVAKRLPSSFLHQSWTDIKEPQDCISGLSAELTKLNNGKILCVSAPGPAANGASKLAPITGRDLHLGEMDLFLHVLQLASEGLTLTPKIAESLVTEIQVCFT